MAYVTLTITPYLLYEDLGAALDSLEKALALRRSHPLPTGKVAHAEMQFKGCCHRDGLPRTAISQSKGPRTGYSRAVCSGDALDEHFAVALAAGAFVLEHPTEQAYGDRRCEVEYPESHRWLFAEATVET